MQYPSIVVEWDNALLSGNGRAFEGLRRLHEQLWDASGRFDGEAELVVTFDPALVPQPVIAEALVCIGGERGWPGRLLIAAAPVGTDYYGQKNFGFRLTGNGIVVFLDSDLIPQAGWLDEMVAPFADYRRAVVVGNTYMDTDSFYARCVALFWIFETRSTERELRTTDWLVSNNIAFRRQLFDRLPFPTRSTYRGQCSELGAILARHGVPIYRNPAAQTAHPPPNGIRHFIGRAMHAGDDECAYRRFEGPVRMIDALKRFCFDLGVMRRRTRARAPIIGVGPGTELAGCLLGAAYYSCKCLAFLLAVLSPRAVRWISAPFSA